MLSVLSVFIQVQGMVREGPEEAVGILGYHGVS